MGVITLKLDDILERKLREKAFQIYGLARGSLSRAVENAISVWLTSATPATKLGRPVRYFALRGRRSVLEAASLTELAGKLEKAGIDPRDVEIRSSLPVSKVEKLGLRVASRAT